MATDRVWIGGTSADPETAANWDPSGAPADTDNLIFNDQAQQSCNGHDLGAINVTIQVEATFPEGFTIGSSGDAFIVAGIPYMRFKGPGIGTSYITTDTTETDLCVLDSAGSANPVLVLDGTVKNVAVVTGRMALAATAVLSQRADIYAARGGQTSKLTIPSGVTLTGAKIHIKGGMAAIAAAVPDIFMSDGECVLEGTAGVTGAVEMKGGQFWWDAQSTIALAEVHGGNFAFRLSRITRVLTSGVLGGDGVMDFDIGGLKDSLFPNGVLQIGENQVLWPRGTLLTPAFGSGGMSR